MTQITIGGERLGSGKKMKAEMHNYNRSTHDLSYIWRSTMAAGTIVPFMSQIGLPGDTFDINLNCEVLTHPTTGPLFGSYKVQLDVFLVPMRLYNGKLHMNMLNIGRDMSSIKLPQVVMVAQGVDINNPIDNQQINPSSIFSYLGIRGLGTKVGDPDAQVIRYFNATAWLGYWDIVKNYYANKQEEIGAVIHKQVSVVGPTLLDAEIKLASEGDISINITPPVDYSGAQQFTVESNTILVINTTTGIPDSFNPLTGIVIYYEQTVGGLQQVIRAGDMFENVTITSPTQMRFENIKAEFWLGNYKIGLIIAEGIQPPNPDEAPEIATFPLENIDNMRKDILHATGSVNAFTVAAGAAAPYGLALDFSVDTGQFLSSKQYSQEGLALKTYNSDLFNNWISTEWIDGADGVSAVTAIDTSGGSFTIDELNLSQKIYNMLNRIALSGGSYDDWLDAVYTHDRQRSVENPIYMGGLIKELIFQEVISQSQTEGKPLGTLAGRGRLSGKDKGGHVIVKVDEPAYIMAMVSLTPRIDYSQGNAWDTNLQTINDLHKPALDEIGFQDLITDQMAWFDTQVDMSGAAPYVLVTKSAGKQPAWINYMTNVNKVYGNFADRQQMFMALNRRYDAQWTAGVPSIKDLTTYIDPSKFNHVFADTRADAQNFWTQIGVNITARRKMSAKIIPNL